MSVKLLAAHKGLPAGFQFSSDRLTEEALVRASIATYDLTGAVETFDPGAPREGLPTRAVRTSFVKAEDIPALGHLGPGVQVEDEKGAQYRWGGSMYLRDGGFQRTDLIDARDFGIFPGKSNSVLSDLRVALNYVATQGPRARLVVQAGQYNYDNNIDVSGGGGMVCLNGRAQFNAQHPSYDNNCISFTGASSSNPAVGFGLENIDFNNATMPNTGLSNGAGEYAGFVRLTNIRDVYVARNRVFKNFGGFILLRNVMDALLEVNECRDLWKDVFHTTGLSRNVTRRGNRVFNCGDDAYATVGYLSQLSRPEFIYDYHNFAYGVRRGRAFAYVGAAHVRGYGNFVDGRTVNPFQALSPNGHHYRGSCALYIASEAGFGTYGCTDVDVHVDARYMGPTVVSPGGGAVSSSTETTNTLAVFRIGEGGSGDDMALKDIKVRGTIEYSPRINVHVTGVENLDLDVKVLDNTDSEGWVGAAGTYTAQAAEFQGLRGNSRYKLDIKTCNHIAVVVGGTCKGTLDAHVKINDVLKTQVHDGMFFASGSVFDKLNVTMDLDWDIPSGRLDRFVDIQCAFGELNVAYTGRGSATNVNSLITGGSAMAVPLVASPQLIVNTTPNDWTVQARGGVVTTIEQARVLTHHARPVASVSGNVLTIAGDVTTLYLNTRHCVFLSDHASVNDSTANAIAISSASFSGGNTSVTLASAPPAVGTYSRVAPLHTEGFAAIDGSTTRFLNLPRDRAFRITYTAAPTVNVVPAKQ